MATKHMNAAPGDFAETVLMPGDPLRAQYIADTYFDDARRVNDVRNMWGFTGTYKGYPVSVMAHGMGIPSASIYTTELIADYGVKRVIRVGSCGTTHPDVKLRDIIIGLGACTDANINRIRFGGYDYAPIATFDLVKKAVAAAEQHGVRHHVGNLFSADLFYTPDTAMFETMQHLIGYRFDDFAPRNRIAHVEAPVLIVHGAEDDVVPIGSLHELAAAQPSAETLIVQGAAHSDLAPFESKVGHITEFLDRNLHH